MKNVGLGVNDFFDISLENIAPMFRKHNLAKLLQVALMQREGIDS